MFGQPLAVIDEKEPLDFHHQKSSKKSTILKWVFPICMVSLIYILYSTNTFQQNHELSYFSTAQEKGGIVGSVPQHESPLKVKRADTTTSDTTNTDKTTETTGKTTTTDSKQTTTNTDTKATTTSNNKQTTTTGKNSETTTTGKSSETASQKQDSKTTSDKSQDSKKTTTSQDSKSKETSSSKTTTSTTSDSTTTTSQTSQTTSTSTSAPVPFYDQAGLRFMFVVFGFVFLNMFAICVHHVYMLATRSANAYKTVADDISPF